VSISTSPPPVGGGASAITSTPASPSEPCPLCGAPLHVEQDWCLRCGAAARTRLATSPNWRVPLAALAVVITLSLGVLAAALVALAGDGGSSAPPRTVLRTASAPIAPTQPGTVPGASTLGSAAPKATAPRTATSPTRTAAPKSALAISPATVKAALERLRHARNTTTPKLNQPTTKLPKIKLPKLKINVHLPPITLPNSDG
jgi:hypothetical protein